MTDGEDVVTDADEITVLIVDDHPVVRDGLRGMFAASRNSTWSGRPPPVRRP